MVSERKMTANRANARLSTGPKTLEGKRVVRGNALRHGLLSRDVVLPNEDAGAFDNLSNGIHSALSPAGPLEDFLVDRIVNLIWRLRRLDRIEAALFYWRRCTLEIEKWSAVANSYVKPSIEAFLPGNDYTPEITNEVAYGQAMEQLKQVQEKLGQYDTFPGRSFDADMTENDRFAKVARYETSLERSLSKALHELQRLQAARQGQPVPLPQAVDLNVFSNPAD